MNSSAVLTALDIDYSEWGEQLLHYSQLSSQEPDAPVNIAIVAKNYLEHLPSLYQLWKKQASTRPWHIIALDTRYEQSQQRLERYSGQFFNMLQEQWPLALPGLHRIDIQDYRFSISVLFTHDEQDWKQFSASIHCFICDDDLPLTALRMSVPNLCIVGEMSGDWMQRLSTQQFQVELVKKGVQRNLWRAYSRRPAIQTPASKGRNIIIIGAGVAGAGVAFALANRGWQVSVLDPLFSTSIPDSEMYRYASGAVTPLITADDCHKARLSRAGVLRAKARWKNIAQQAGINACGTLELNRDKGHAKDLLEAVSGLGFPEKWVRLVDPKEASQLAGIPVTQNGAFFSAGMQIPPVRLAHTLLQHERIECVPMKVHHIQPLAQGFSVYGERLAAAESYDVYDESFAGEFEVLKSPFVVLATAMSSLSLLQRSGLDSKVLKSGQKVSALGRIESLHALAGEVMMIPAENLNGGPRCVIGGQGYYLPAQNGFCVMGSTYVHGQLYPTLTTEGQQNIWQKMPVSLPTSLKQLQESGELKGRACVRAVVQGRLPIIAELPHVPGFWLVGAYASHGMTWSSLAGDIIGASLEGEPLPIEKDLLMAVSLKA